MNLTEKQIIALTIIEENFKNKNFGINDIKEYNSTVATATLANLQAKGILEKISEKPAKYRYINKSDRTEIKPLKLTAEKVVELETGIIYESAQKALEAKGAGFSKIKDAANGSRRVAGMLHWCKISDLPVNFTIEDCKQKIKIIDAAFGYYDGKKVNRGKRVRNIDLDQEFYSASEAARFFNLTSDAVASCCRGEKSTAAGYHWEYVEE